MQLRRNHTEYLVRCQHCGRAGHDMLHFVHKDVSHQVCSNACATAFVEKTDNGEQL